MKFQLAVASLLFFSIACSHKDVRQQTTSADSSQLKAIIDQYTNSTKHLDAYSATYFNIEEDLGKFGDYGSDDFWARAKQIDQTAVDSLKSVQMANLTPAEKIEYRLFKEDVEVGLRGFDFPGRFLDVNQMGSRLRDYMDSSSEGLTSFPFNSVAHYDAYVKRSEGFPAYVDNEIAQMRQGLKEHVVLSCTVASKVPVTYKDALVKSAEKNPFYRPVGFMPKEIAAADRTRLTADFKKMINERIVPAYTKFDHFYRTEYLPHCRQGFGIGNLPQGKEWYAYDILASTNLSLDPLEVHKTGLREVERISGELEKIKNVRGFKGTLPAFMKAMANDPKQFYKNGDEIFQAFEKVKAETAKRVPNYFSLVPKSDFKIVATSNPEDPAGQYENPTEMVPYGRFIVNTINVRAVPIFGVTTLMLHETVPGHHFQLALQYEMKDQLSEYQRKIYGSNSFVEGWALYSEYLGNEMGMFTDPVQRFGNLNDEMLRAVRLVVDTGIHALGWSQKQAIAYMREHLASDAKDIEVEANRYSVWPGQALGYKIGQLKILELRHKAEQELGPKFDIKGFHGAVIGNGTVSLGVLESQVNDWIAKVKGT